jgi:hypothetical protein
VATARPATVQPQQVAVDGRYGQALGGVAMPLGVVQHLLVGPPAGALHPGGQPVHAHRLAGCGHLPKPAAQVVQAGDEAAVGLAVPHGSQRAEQQVQAVADLGLGDPDRPPGTPIRQPVQQHRGDGVQADLQRQRPGAALSGPTRRGQVGQVGGQPGQHLGGQRRTRQYDGMGSDLLAGFDTLPMVWSPSTSGRTEHHGHPQWVLLARQGRSCWGWPAPVRRPLIGRCRGG